MVQGRLPFGLLSRRYTISRDEVRLAPISLAPWTALTAIGVAIALVGLAFRHRIDPGVIGLGAGLAIVGLTILIAAFVPVRGIAVTATDIRLGRRSFADQVVALEIEHAPRPFATGGGVVFDSILALRTRGGERVTCVLARGRDPHEAAQVFTAMRGVYAAFSDDLRSSGRRPEPAAP